MTEEKSEGFKGIQDRLKLFENSRVINTAESGKTSGVASSIGKHSRAINVPGEAGKTAHPDFNSKPAPLIDKKPYLNRADKPNVTAAKPLTNVLQKPRYHSAVVPSDGSSKTDEIASKLRPNQIDSKLTTTANNTNRQPDIAKVEAKPITNDKLYTNDDSPIDNSPKSFNKIEIKTPQPQIYKVISPVSTNIKPAANDNLYINDEEQSPIMFFTPQSRATAALNNELQDVMTKQQQQLLRANSEHDHKPQSTPSITPSPLLPTLPQRQTTDLQQDQPVNFIPVPPPPPLVEVLTKFNYDSPLHSPFSPIKHPPHPSAPLSDRPPIPPPLPPPNKSTSIEVELPAVPPPPKSSSTKMKNSNSKYKGWPALATQRLPDISATNCDQEENTKVNNKKSLNDISTLLETANNQEMADNNRNKHGKLETKDVTSINQLPIVPPLPIRSATSSQSTTASESITKATVTFNVDGKSKIPDVNDNPPPILAAPPSKKILMQKEKVKEECKFNPEDEYDDDFDLTQMPWYFEISKEEATNLMKTGTNRGFFLVRPSDNQYVLMLRVDEQNIKKFKIQRYKEGWILGEIAETKIIHDNIAILMNHYLKTGVKCGSVLVNLTHPVPKKG